MRRDDTRDRRSRADPQSARAPTGGPRTRDCDRAVSTTADVALAMVFISAAMVVLAVYLTGGLAGHDPQTADEAAETVAGSTIAVEYDVDGVRTASTFDETAVEDPAAYERTRHGSIAGLVADAAVANATLWGDRPSATPDPYLAAVDGASRSQLVGAETRVFVRAIWRPWEGSDVQGVATAGPRPPRTGDVSSVTVTVSSDLEVDEAAFRANYTDADATARLLGEAVVAHHFPRTESQRALQARGARRQFVVHRYRRFADVLGVGRQFDPDDHGTPLHRETADAGRANEILAEAFAGRALARGGVPDRFDDVEDAREWLTAGTVHVTVQTWTADS